MGICEKPIEDAVAKYVESWIELISGFGCKVPNWDPVAIARYDIERTQREHNNPDNSTDSNSFIKDAFRSAHRQMASDLKWDEIRHKVIGWAQKMDLRPNDVYSCEDFANEVVSKAIEKWDPHLETDCYSQATNLRGV